MKVADEIGQVKRLTLLYYKTNEILGKMILEGEKKGLTEVYFKDVQSNPSRKYWPSDKVLNA
jgi:chorismate mutase